MTFIKWSKIWRDGQLSGKWPNLFGSSIDNYNSISYFQCLAMIGYAMLTFVNGQLLGLLGK